MESGCTRRRSSPGQTIWSRLPPEEKLYVLEALSKYRRAGGSLPAFCTATSLSTASIERWSSAHKATGRAGLVPKKRRHKAVIAGWERTKRVLEIFHGSPLAHGINRTSWTGEALAQAYEARWGEGIAPGTARRHIAQCGYTYTRAKEVLTSSDPEYYEKLHAILEKLHSLAEDEAFFFVDELGPVRVRKHGGRSYMKKDSITRVPKIQPHRGSVCLVGALCARTNQVSWLYCASKDSRAMIDITEVLFNQYHAMRTLYLTWDAASWHSSDEFVTWLNAFNNISMENDDGPRIEVLPLPANAQFLDVIESVFSGMKKAVIHNSNYQSSDEMKGAISRHFRERNTFFSENPKRAGKKIWEIDFFQDVENIRAGNYRPW
jgi:transposase